MVITSVSDIRLARRRAPAVQLEAMRLQGGVEKFGELFGHRVYMRSAWKTVCYFVDYLLQRLKYPTRLYQAQRVASQWATLVFYMHAVLL